MKCIIPAKIRKSCRGAVMIETFLSMLMIFLILFGLLQIFYVAAGQMFTDYAALRGARSKCVGFVDYLSNREAKINAIGASGDMIHPQESITFSGKMEQFAAEKVMIEDYILGDRWLEYEFWNGRLREEQSFYQANEEKYRVLVSQRENDPTKDEYILELASKLRNRTTFNTSYNNSGDMLNTYTEFENYTLPLATPMRRHFFGESIDIRGKASLANYALQFLNQ